MPDKVRWGVLGAARIATNKVIPGMQKGEWSRVDAIASRDLAKAKETAAGLGIAKAYGSYEELIADPEIEAVYVPLPNHLHVPWSIRAAEAGKHVLCEKPIGLNAEECRKLMAVRDRTGVKIGEAFMVRVHPQWLRARELARSGAIGDLRSILCAFSYFDRNPQNVRQVRDWGGGALLDIGCYPIQISRFIFETEPLRVTAAIERDPDWDVDRLTSGMMEFANGHSVFTCGTQVIYYQRVQIFGTTGRIEIEIPFNAPRDAATRVFYDPEGNLSGEGIRTELIPVCDQYTIQGDLFSKAIREGGEVTTPLEDSLCNMAVIDAMFEAAEKHAWVEPARER